ncbi:DUF2076 domain-containing protein [uncultured Thiodictyon sp.]|uniref:DUF2076 domain-containing protein n=1 Tax=uncultured Thiodictyon sp. TaxID=1846217 RepID=UPI0025EA0918|nr:DUF2076 domain-containing protein [uncultured Thiodictyon sp.]
MDQHEQQLIADLMSKLKEAEQRSAPRDRDAEQLIADALLRQPATPYYMAQVILVQDHALQAQQQRIQDLEKELAQRPAADGGRFLGGLFGGGAGQSVGAARPGTEPPPAATGGGWSNPSPPAEERVSALPPGAQYAAAPANRGPFGAAPAGGGGFLSSALTTAVGVAGGMMAASALSSVFGVGESHAAGLSGAGAETAAAAPLESAAASRQPVDDEPQLPDE